MAMYELFDDSGDQGLLVVGELVDRTFREEADQAGRQDERLVTVRDPESLLEPDALALAARGLSNRLATFSANPNH